ncbi:MAG: undecaprenyl/decaprenyl-phosphate alpha-N-acetylglucosaminyl 1-phosphate transferase [Deltaproteobacteria bacterium]|nr:undecaprenyl/decaprenyl-phosphate alpha-N-acetylglucosaminyl 1-phosphate transferase [Deltaproteobacteria bacterium]
MTAALSPVLLLPVATALALFLALYLTPVIIRAAERYHIVDRPDGKLKTQRAAVPYLGGLAVFLSFLATVAIVHPLESRILAILLAASIVVCFGLVDDLGTLVPKDKLIGQLIAAFVAVRAGVHVQFEFLPDLVDQAISVFWLVAIINAFNIIDVHDGLCTGLAAIATAFFGVFAVLQQETLVAVLCAALFGALLGFLRYNFPPARIYLGDTGSMLIGLVLGALAMIDDYSTVNPFAAAFSPLAVLAVPLFDMGFVVLARVANGQPFYYGSPDHFAVRLRLRGIGARRIALGSYLAAAVFGALALIAAYSPTLPAVIIIGASVVAFAVAVALLWRLDPRRLPAAPSASEVAATAPPPALSDRLR